MFVHTNEQENTHMGANATCALKSGASADMVADVIALAFGKSRTDETRFFEVADVKVIDTSVPGMVGIMVEGPVALRRNGGNPFTYLHYDYEQFNPDYIDTPVAICPPSTALWLAVCRKVLDVFGGTLICTDASEESQRFTAEGQVRRGMSYEEAHDIIATVTPVTKADVRANVEFATYGDR